MNKCIFMECGVSSRDSTARPCFVKAKGSDAEVNPGFSLCSAWTVKASSCGKRIRINLKPTSFAKQNQLLNDKFKVAPPVKPLHYFIFWQFFITFPNILLQLTKMHTFFIQDMYLSWDESHAYNFKVPSLSKSLSSEVLNYLYTSKRTK